MIDLYGLSPAQIAEKFDLLTEERDHYKRELGLAVTADKIDRLKRRWKLTPREAQILAALHTRAGRTVGRALLMDVLYGGHDEPEIKIIDVFSCKLRKKMGGFDYIETVWGVGFRLTPLGVEAVDAALLVGQC